MGNYKEFYTRLKATGHTKEEIIYAFTNGRTESLRALSDKEYIALCASLRKAQGKIAEQQLKGVDQQANNLRKALISIFHQMQYPDAAAAAKSWAEKMGVGSGASNVKRPFNKYTPGELRKLIYKAQIALADFQKSTNVK